jgi:hypothetical protein
MANEFEFLFESEKCSSSKYCSSSKCRSSSKWCSSSRCVRILSVKIELNRFVAYRRRKMAPVTRGGRIPYRLVWIPELFVVWVSAPCDEP